MKGNVMQVNEDNFRDFSSEDVVNAVAIVKQCFDTDAPRNLIHYFHFMLRDGELFQKVQLSPIERAFVDYVGYAFARIAEDGKSTQVAFGLQPGKGEHPRVDTSDRDFNAAVYMVLHIRNGEKWESAKRDAAALFFDGGGHKAVEAAYAKLKGTLILLDDETLKSYLPPDSKTIKHD